MIYDAIRSRENELQNDLKFSFHPKFMIFKKDLLDYAFKNHQINSVAELGCVWEIDCAYGIYALQKYSPKKVTMVDVNWTNSALDACSHHKEITIIHDNFGKDYMPGKIGAVDTIILFDVLLHQVSPNWDRVLQIYAPYTKSFLIVEPIFTASPITIRLFDLGKEEYFKNVPHDPKTPPYDKLFEKMYEVENNRFFRDFGNFWQWGITQRDLLHTMDCLGFDPYYLNNSGQLGHLANFVYSAFMFKKRV